MAQDPSSKGGSAADRKRAALPDAVRLGLEVTDLDNELAALRARFDQFFMGLEKRSPAPDCEEYKKRLLRLKGGFIRNTAVKFRVNALHQKFLSYERLWLKTLKEMEEGTYRRDLFKLRRKNSQGQLDAPAAKAKPKSAAEVADALDDLDVNLDDFNEEPAPPAPAPVAPPPAAKAPVTPPPVAASPAARPPAQAPAAPAVTARPPAAAPANAAKVPAAKPPPAPADARPAAAAAPASAPKPAAPKPSASLSLSSASAAKPASSVTLTSGLGAKPAAPRTVPQPGTPAAAAPAKPATPRTVSQPGMPAASSAPRPAAPAARPAPPAAAPPRPPAASNDPLSRERVQAIYEAYVSAKRQCKENTSGLTYDAVAQSLQKQVPKLMQQPGVKSVDFKVVIKDGKAVLKAVTKQ